MPLEILALKHEKRHIILADLGLGSGLHIESSASELDPSVGIHCSQ
jgi:hypothetical protein